MAKGPTELYHRQLHHDYEIGSLTCLKSEVIKKRSNNNFPLVLNIEPTNACNLKCSFCVNKNVTEKFGISFMNPKLFGKIMAEIQVSNLIMVNFHKDGEGLLHPNIHEMIACTKKVVKNAMTHMNTNGLLLSEKGESILKAGIDDVTVSIDAFWPNTFKKLKGKNLLTQVLISTHKFLEMIKQGNYKTKVRVKIMESDLVDSSEVYLFMRYWEKYCDVQVTGTHNWSGAIDMDVTDETKTERHACPLLFYTLAINADGQVSICNVDHDRTGVVGDANTQTIKEIWQGDKLKEIRKQHLSGIYKPNVCQDCTIWAGCNNANNILKVKGEML